jgi:hypothetical protein
MPLYPACDIPVVAKGKLSHVVGQQGMQMLVAVVPFKDGISLFLQYFYCRFSGAQ